METDRNQIDGKLENYRAKTFSFFDSYDDLYKRYVKSEAEKYQLEKQVELLTAHNQMLQAQL